MDSFLKLIKSTWISLGQLAVWVCGIIAVFVLEPPELWWGAPQSANVLLARFLVTVLVGIVILACLRWHEMTHLRGWVTVTIVTAVVGVTALFVYNYFYDQWTCWWRVGSPHTVIGSEYLPEAKQSIQNKNLHSCTEIIQKAGGATDQLWDANELLKRYFLLNGLFVAVTAVLSVTIVAIVQSLRCAGVINQSREGSSN